MTLFDSADFLVDLARKSLLLATASPGNQGSANLVELPGRGKILEASYSVYSQDIFE